MNRDIFDQGFGEESESDCFFCSGWDAVSIGSTDARARSIRGDAREEKIIKGAAAAHNYFHAVGFGAHEFEAPRDGASG